MKADVQYEVPTWVTSELWAQLRNIHGDVVEIPRAQVDMGGRVRFTVAADIVTHATAVAVYDAPEGGSLIGTVMLPVPRQLRGPATVHYTLDSYSH